MYCLDGETITINWSDEITVCLFRTSLNCAFVKHAFNSQVKSYKKIYESPNANSKVQSTSRSEHEQRTKSKKKQKRNVPAIN